MIIYARYSKDDQNKLSIEHQVGLVKDWLEFNDFTDLENTEVSDPGISDYLGKEVLVKRSMALFEAKDDEPADRRRRRSQPVR